MGNLLRQFWVPALRAARLEADGAPARVRLFGENFVAFRDTQGRVGFLDEGCPHRGVSLALGRNEECGLRCIFHGWKFDVNGQVLETPSEPPGSTLASKVRVNHYPTREMGGVVWVWLGQGEKAPQFPAFAFDGLPLENVVARAAIINSNWLAALEGLLDSSHVSSLHKTWLPPETDALQGPNAGVTGALAPRYEIEERPYGLMANARRQLPDGTQVNRKTEYVLPFYCFIPNTLKSLRSVSMGVPIDDEHTTYWNIAWDTEGPLDAATVDRLRNQGKIGPDLDDFYQPKYGAGQIWGQNRELMKQGYYTGFEALPIEDFVVQESQGAIVDRSKEHLGQSDVAVIRARRLLADLVRDYQQGKRPGILTQEIDYGQIRPVHEIVAATGEKLEVPV
jgi:phenylpropionate dioxygenase-like ring-hydroxylating dioxygenase large terminal subunit